VDLCDAHPNILAVKLDGPTKEDYVWGFRVGFLTFGIRDATQIHMFDRGRTTKFDLKGHAVIHTAPNVRKVPKDSNYPCDLLQPGDGAYHPTH
jgi:hypothetical protein